MCVYVPLLWAEKQGQLEYKYDDEAVLTNPSQAGFGTRYSEHRSVVTNDETKKQHAHTLLPTPF